MAAESLSPSGTSLQPGMAMLLITNPAQAELDRDSFSTYIECLQGRGLLPKSGAVRLDASGTVAGAAAAYRKAVEAKETRAPLVGIIVTKTCPGAADEIDAAQRMFPASISDADAAKLKAQIASGMVALISLTGQGHM